MEERDPLPYVAKILKEKLHSEEKSLIIFEANLNSEDFYTKRQAEGNVSSNKSRVEELKTALIFLKTYKK